MLLTDEQIREISQIINDYHSAFVASVIDPNAIDPATLERLKAKGIVNVQINSIEDAYLLGQVAAALESVDVPKMSYEDFKEHVRKNPVPLTAIEKRSIEVAAQSAGQWCKGLGNRVDMATGETIINADQALARAMREQIADTTALNLAKRETVKQLRSDLGHKTKDWARDLDRIAITEVNDAHQYGVADAIAKKHGDPWVFKRPMPDACEACQRLHLGEDGQPMLWRLSALVANGTNVGKKRVDWLPVVGSVHPHCQCQLMRAPEGWGFNEEGQLTPDGELGVRFEDTETFGQRREAARALRKSMTTGRVVYQGIPIGVENPAGSVRHWRDASGGEGSTRMLYAYGFVEGTRGTDGDEIDVFVGPNPDAPIAWVVHQQDPKSGLYDEDKVMLGFDSEAHALAAYRQHYDRRDFEVTCSPITIDHFKRWYAATLGGREEGVCEPMKKAAPRFVVPLEKALRTESGDMDPAYAAAIHQRAGDRAPGPGLGVNFLFNVPAKPPPQTLAAAGHDPTPQDLVDAGKDRGKALKRDRSVYEFDQPLPSVAKPWVIPEWYWGDRRIEPEQMEANKKMAVDFGTRNLQRPRNRVEVEDDANDE